MSPRKKYRLRKKAKRFVARNLPKRLQEPPKWHIYQRVDTLSVGGAPVIGTGQWFFDIPHGLSSDYDGLVALMCTSKNNIIEVANPTPPPALLGTSPDKPNGFLQVYKSYMVLYITNNSSTPVYAKMAIFRPRKHINIPEMRPSPLADADLEAFGQGDIQNEWVGPQALVNLGMQLTYQEYPAFTDGVRPTIGLNNFGTTWHSSPSFRRFYKGKAREIMWAPMECKKFVFSRKRPVSLDLETEYTMQPATTSSTNFPVNFVHAPVFYAVPTDSGFADMHKGRGMYVSFLCNGIPVRTDPGDAPVQVTMTQPVFDIHYINAYKYGWSPNTYRQWTTNQNPLGTGDPAGWMAIPMPGAIVPGRVQTSEF